MMFFKFFVQVFAVIGMFVVLFLILAASLISEDVIKINKKGSAKR